MPEENVKLILSLYPAGDPDWVQLIHSISERVLVLNNDRRRREGSPHDVSGRLATLTRPLRRRNGAACGVERSAGLAAH